ncbi:MAG: SGNH/GDSL hydrolase family protein, partial [Vulcanimicrobiaceae bacterium]
VAPCTGPNLAALSAATALGTRLNPKTTPLDVAVPGQTLHEALFQYQPTGDPCTTYPIAQLQGLNSIVGAENLNFYPVLANFGPGTTQIAAAVRLRPTLALVWLGSNDLVKFLFSNGAVAAPDAGTFQADLTSVIAQLQAAGAKVAVANLFDVLAVPQFTPVAAIPQVLAARGVPTTLAPPIAGAIDAFLAGFGVGNGGFLTLTGAGKIVGVVQAAVPAIVGGAPPAAAIQAGFTQLQASPNAFGAGDFVVDAIAAQAAQLNVAYNAAIAAAAKSRGAALVDVHGLFGPIEANGGVYPLPSNPKCCSLQLGGGLFSNDGLHPSNTGYAVLANLFIQTVDQAYGTTIPPVNVAAINATDLYSPH